MDQLIPSLVTLVEPFGNLFHPSVFATFQALLAGWIVCLGPTPSAGSGRLLAWPPNVTTTRPMPCSTRPVGIGTSWASFWRP